MYTPYGNAQLGNQFQDQYGQQNIQHPQPQHGYNQGMNPGMNQVNQNQMNPGMNQPTDGNNQFYNNFFQDPATSMAAQFAKNGFDQSGQYLQQNFGSFIPQTSNLNYYFKISNSYVINKLILILFPFRNPSWTRISNNVQSETEQSNFVFAPPIQDINAPDLYIPFMSYITYVLLWAVFQGLKGDFHPQLFGYLASQAFACVVSDIFIFKLGLYLLSCKSPFWDVVSFSGYKYVPITVLLILKYLTNGGYIFYALVCFFICTFAFFLMRSLRNMVLPNSSTMVNNSIPPQQRRTRILYLLGYSLGLQSLIIFFMNINT